MISLAMIAAAFGLFAQTTVPAGPVQGNWTSAGSPYNIMGDISIPNNAVLSIAAGVEVVFQGTFKLEVMGQILSNGVDGNMVTFTAQDTLNGWQSIRFINSGAGTNPPSSFNYSVFSYAKAVHGANPMDPLNQGGAVWASNAGTVTFNHCNFVRCKSMGDGSVIYAVDGTNIVMNGCIIKFCETEWFGAIYANGGAVDIQNCQFINNDSDVFGAAMYLYQCISANIVSSTFSNNSAGALGAIYALYTPLVIKNSLFSGNFTYTGRGGAIGLTGGTATITNCTFTNNLSPMEGGAIWFNLLSAPPVITNSIFWNNLPNAISAVSTTYTLSYCSMQVPQGGPTNISGNPLFSNPDIGDFTLLPSSPCVDAGTPDATGLNLPPLDLAGLPRIVDGNQDSIARIDIGCFEMPAPLALGEIAGQVIDGNSQPVSGALITAGGVTVLTNTYGLYSFTILQGTYSVTCSKAGYVSATQDDVAVSTGQMTMVNFMLSTVSNSDDIVPPALFALNSYPNPFTVNTAISFSLSKTNAVKLEIYNLKGQRVITLLDGLMNAGDHSISWNGLDLYHRQVSNGIYLYRLTSGKEVLTKRIMKL
ncbi:MAG: T9SS type A sorting domain-containing protein [Candidatus Cloacimonadaceae bacterium]|nr:T9SS type A sorting domain-containing protein [Candidatus Cloacimonadaceae bacterium]